MHGQCEYCDRDVQWTGGIFVAPDEEVPEVCHARYADLATTAHGEYDGIFSAATHWVLPWDLRFDDTEEK